jgi:curved DNA-binding protein CbpA
MQAVPKEDLYAELGVAPDASPDAIRRAYRARAFELHPDRNPAPHARERFQRLNQAYEVLSEPGARRAYDTSRTITAPLRAVEDIIAELFTLRPKTAGDATVDGCPHCDGSGTIMLDVGFLKIRRTCSCKP